MPSRVLSALRVVRQLFYRSVEENVFEVHPKDLQKVRDDKWLRFVLKNFKGDVHDTVLYLAARSAKRNALNINNWECSVKSDETTSNAVKLVGNDKKGCKLMFVDLTELAKIPEDGLILLCLHYWFERAERLKCDKISIAIHHGKDKSMEHCPALIRMIFEVLGIYINFVQSLFVFDDCLSSNCRQFLEAHVLHLIANFPDISRMLIFVNEPSYSKHFTLDDKYTFSKGQLTTVQKKVEEVEKLGKEEDIKVDDGEKNGKEEEKMGQKVEIKDKQAETEDKKVETKDKEQKIGKEEEKKDKDEEKRAKEGETKDKAEENISEEEEKNSQEGEKMGKEVKKDCKEKQKGDEVKDSEVSVSGPLHTENEESGSTEEVQVNVSKKHLKAMLSHLHKIEDQIAELIRRVQKLM